MKKIQKTPVNFKLRLFWAVVLTMFSLAFLVSPVQAQQIRIGTGSHFVNGTYVTLTGDGIVNQGTLRNKTTGVIKLTGNWQNDGTCSSEKGSIVSLGGSATQVIGGSNPTVFGTLRLNNGAGFSLAQQTTVNGKLDFQNGMLSTGNYLVTIGDTGTITNASATKYVDGKLALTFSSLGSKTFPTGKGGNYRPVTLQFTGLTGTSIVTAEQFETGLSGTLPANTTLLTTDRHWTINQAGGSNMQYFVTLDATDYTPTRPLLMMKQDAGTMVSCATTAPGYTNSTAFTTFSDFGLGEVCINPDNGGEIASDQAFCYITVPVTITSSSPPSGQTGDLQYKWQVSITDAYNNFTDIPDSDFAEYTPGTATQTAWYRRLAKVTCASGGWITAAISNTVTIRVYPVSVGGSIAGTTNVCTGTNSTGLTLSGHTGDVVRWEYTTSDWGAAVPLSNTSTDYTAENLTATTSYRAVIKSGVCGEAYSGTATITVELYVAPLVSISLTTGTNPSCPGNEVTYSALPVNGGSSPSYLWYRNDVLSAVSETFNLVPLDGDQVYVVMASSLLCPAPSGDTSETITHQVITPESVSVSIRASRGPDGQIKFKAYSVNSGATPVYKWYKTNNIGTTLIAEGVADEIITTCKPGDSHWVKLTSSLPCTEIARSEQMCTY